MTVATDYYELLGVRRDASDDDLKKAYRRLARELHPDANPGDAAAEELFKQVTVAYEVLRDPERRQRYDRFGPDAVRGSGSGTGGQDPFGFGVNLGDIFETFFGGQAAGASGGANSRAGTRRGNDAEVALALSLYEAAFGAERELAITLPVPCDSCEGSGAKAGTMPTTCPDCRGTGQVQRVRQSFLGQMVTASPCVRCHGLGENIANPCPDCRGEGRRTKERSLTVEVPAGVDDGATLRISGAGPAAVRGGVPGDLYVHLRVTPEENLERSGIELLTTVAISFAQAALGTTVQVKSLEGPLEVEVPPGVQSGAVLRVAGQGTPRLRSRHRGDLLVTIAVETPTRLGKEEEELYRRLAQMRGEAVAPPDTGLLSRLRSSFH
ncbi:MAG: molecular chaperone DnaJ [Acidimicrobiales bacterium]